MCSTGCDSNLLPGVAAGDRREFCETAAGKDFAKVFQQFRGE